MRWTWTLESDMYVLRPDPLPPGVSEVGFQGRALVPGARGPAAGRDAVRLDQVHGARVVRSDAPRVIPECDGVHTRVPGLLLTVRTADCLPVLLASPVEGIVLLHAGWRGLVRGILEAGVDVFAERSRLVVLLGPAIGPCCYEVGPEVAARFPEEALLASPEGKPRLDLVRAAALRLHALGLGAEQIHAAPACTRCHQHLMHSSRGSGAGPGRILGFAAG